MSAATRHNPRSDFADLDTPVMLDRHPTITDQDRADATMHVRRNAGDDADVLLDMLGLTNTPMRTRVKPQRRATDPTCVNGHPWPEQPARNSRGHRICLECKREAAS